MKIDSRNFYSQYHGHDVELLRQLFSNLVLARRLSGEKICVVWLAGDSSMDNKFWFNEERPAVNGYERVLSPPLSKPDIAYHLNSLFADKRQTLGDVYAVYVAINCAVEESTIGMRGGRKLLDQDQFILDHVTEDDILIMSVGGNDIALRPTCATMLSMGWLSRCSSTKNVLDGSAFGIRHFQSLFCNDLCLFTNNLTAKAKPRLFMPSVIYYPDMNSNSPSWSNMMLSVIGYNKNPRHVQAIIDCVVRKIEQHVTPAEVNVPKVVPVAMSKALDGTQSGDYVARVEPSATGGKKIAELFVQTIRNN